MSSFSERLKMALDIRNMKQADLVALTGIGKSSISTYLSGEYVPKQRNVYKIAEALDINEAWLMGFDVPMQPHKILPPDAISYVRGRKLPVLGSIPAGLPVLAAQNIESYDYADVPEDADYFFLRVTGDSMINANIHSGSLVLIKMQPCAENGQIVVCLVNGNEATLKRYYRQDDTVVLQPENPEYQPIIVPAKEFEDGYSRIIGIAVEARIRL